MHDNANIAFQLQETTSIYDTVLGLQPKVGGSAEGERSPEEIVDEFAEQLSEQVTLIRIMRMQRCVKSYEFSLGSNLCHEIFADARRT